LHYSRTVLAQQPGHPTALGAGDGRRHLPRWQTVQVARGRMRSGSQSLALGDQCFLIVCRLTVASIVIDVKR
jgi:hypothetical protein